jgi:hypothetical protein
MMMTARKAVAAAVLGAALPLIIDAWTEPFADRGPVRSWLAGSCKIAAVVAVNWAIYEVSGAPARVPAPMLELEAAGGTRC